MTQDGKVNSWEESQSKESKANRLPILRETDLAALSLRQMPSISLIIDAEEIGTKEVKSSVYNSLHAGIWSLHPQEGSHQAQPSNFSPYLQEMAQGKVPTVYKLHSSFAQKGELPYLSKCFYCSEVTFSGDSSFPVGFSFQGVTLLTCIFKTAAPRFYLKTWLRLNVPTFKIANCPKDRSLSLSSRM